MALEIKLKTTQRERCGVGRRNNMCKRRKLQSPVRKVLLQKHKGLTREEFDVPGFSFWILSKCRGEAEKAEGELAWTAGPE